MSEVLVDFLDLVAFARKIKKHPRTVRRWCDNAGLPFTRNGRTVLIHVPTYRNWLLTHRTSGKREQPRARTKRK